MKPVAKRTVTALLTAACVVTAILKAPCCLFPYAFGLLYVLSAIECVCLVTKRVRPFSPRGLAVLLPALIVLALPFSVLPAVACRNGNLLLLYLIAIVKFSDMGGFAIGIAFGRHKLCPQISPNKTWEGLLGSVVAACLLSILFTPLTQMVLAKALAFGLVAALVGTAGDLVESKFKRWAGVKDSATFMPAGLGGFLDMFDSLLFAPAILAPFL